MSFLFKKMVEELTSKLNNLALSKEEQGVTTSEWNKLSTQTQVNLITELIKHDSCDEYAFYRFALTYIPSKAVVFHPLNYLARCHTIFSIEQQEECVKVFTEWQTILQSNQFAPLPPLMTVFAEKVAHQGLKMYILQCAHDMAKQC